MERERASRTYFRIGVAVCALGFMVSGCYRASPPEVPDFRAPSKKAAKEAPATQPVEERPQPVAQPGPVQILAPPEPAAPPPTPPAPPSPPPPAQTPRRPSLVGTWRVTQMAHGGQSEGLPEGMQMTMTFTESGAVTMSVSGGPMPEAQTTQGSYTLSESQITMTMEGESKTGTCTFAGGDQATIEIEETRIVLQRA